MTTEALAGRTVRQIMKDDPKVEPFQLMSWLETAANGVECAIEQGIYCPEMSLDSVMIARRGEVKITGFGVAQLRTGIGIAPDDDALRAATLLAFRSAVVAAVLPARSGGDA